MINYNKKFLCINKLDSCISTNIVSLYNLEFVFRNTRKMYLILVSDSQSKSYGKFNRRWLTHTGSIASSIVFNSFSENYIKFLSIITNILLINTCYHYNSNILIKWPNDLIIKNRGKIAGIISSTKNFNNYFYIVLGIGINIDNIYAPFQDKLNKSISILQTNRAKKTILRKIFCYGIYYFSRIRDPSFINNNYKISSGKQHLLNRKIFFNVVYRRSCLIIECAVLDIMKDNSIIIFSKKGGLQKIFCGEIIYSLNI